MHDPQADQILNRRTAGRLFENQKKVTPGHIHFMRQLVYNDFGMVMRIQITDHLTDTKRRIILFQIQSPMPAQHDDDLHQQCQTE